MGKQLMSKQLRDIQRGTADTGNMKTCFHKSGLLLCLQYILWRPQLFHHQRPPALSSSVVGSLIQTDLSTHSIGNRHAPFHVPSQCERPRPKGTLLESLRPPNHPPSLPRPVTGQIRQLRTLSQHVAALPLRLGSACTPDYQGERRAFWCQLWPPGGVGGIQTLAPSRLLLTSLLASTPETQQTAPQKN